MLPFSADASAATVGTPIVPVDHGLSEPAGTAVTPDGKVWVSDALLGLCRVSADGHLVEDAAGYCAGEVEVPEGQLPPGPPRPTATFQIAFDADRCEPANAPDDHCDFYVAEGTSGGSGVWRMHWDPATGTIDGAVKIYAAPGDNRVFGLALSPQGDVDFTSKRDNIVRRIVDPHLAEGPVVPDAIGFSLGEGVSSLAHLGQALYLADGGALTKIAAPGPLGGTAVAVPTDGTPAAGEAIGAVGADTDRGVVYAGTSTGHLTDKVLMATAEGYLPDVYDEGYANVTALAKGAGGALLIAHDPTAALSPGVDVVGQAELFSRPLGDLARPHVTFTATPQPVQRSGAPADVSFAWAARSGTTFACTLDGGDEVACDSPFAPAETLGEGEHTFSVRAHQAGGWGPAASWRFEIDTTAPDVAIDADTPREAVGGALRINFTSATHNATFECVLDTGTWRECSPARELAGLALGEHTFRVRAIDPAGNVGDAETWDFTAVPAPVSAPWAPVPVVGAVPPARKAAVARKPKQEILVPCVEVSPSREKALLSLNGGRATVRFAAPGRARYAKLTLRRAAGRRSAAAIVETLGYTRVRAARTGETTKLNLTGAQRRALRDGRTGIAIAYGTCRTQVGAWQWLKNTNQEGSQR